MKTFTVFRHPVEGIEAVKAGFSWPAFLFGCLWMLEKRLWGLAGAWFGIAASLGIIETLLNRGEGRGGVAIAFLLIFVGLSLIPGANGNRWWERNLLKRRYLRMRSVRAAIPEDAIAEVCESADAHARLSPSNLRATYPLS